MDPDGPGNDFRVGPVSLVVFPILAIAFAVVSLVVLWQVAGIEASLVMIAMYAVLLLIGAAPIWGAIGVRRKAHDDLRETAEQLDQHIVSPPTPNPVGIPQSYPPKSTRDRAHEELAQVLAELKHMRSREQDAGKPGDEAIHQPSEREQDLLARVHELVGQLES